MLWRRRVVGLCGFARRQCSSSNASNGNTSKAEASQTTTSTTSATANANSNTTSSSSSSSSSDLARQVERMAMRVPVLDRMVQQHDELVQLQERQRVALERRLVDLEENVGQLHSQVVEANRVAGEVALEQRNVDILVQGIEQRVLGQPCEGKQEEDEGKASESSEAQPSSSSPSAQDVDAAAGSNKKGSKDTSMTPEELLRGLRVVLADATARAELRAMLDGLREEHNEHYNVSSARDEEKGVVAVDKARQNAADTQAYHALQASLQALEAKLSHIQTQIALLATEKSTLEHVTPGFVAAAQASSLESAADVVSRELRLNTSTDTSSSSSSSSSSSPSEKMSAQERAARVRLRELLHYSGALPFRDVAGVTRLSTERILVRRVPANMSAAAVRELCLQCCSPTQRSTRREATPEHNAKDEEEDDDEQGVVISCVARRMSSAEQGNNNNNTTTGDVNDRAFEVTFSSARVAIRVLRALNASAPKPRPGRAAVHHRLQAEPIVSADLNEALQHLRALTQPSHEVVS